VIGPECFYCCQFLCEVTFDPGSKLKEIGMCAFNECALKSIRIPSTIEVIGPGCFYCCQFLCEVTFESDSELKEIGRNAFHERVKCVRVPMGFAVEYHWPDDCQIQYYHRPVAAAIRKSNI
jgi:hypothetical protein